MKIFRGLKTKHPNDKSKNSILDISSRKYKKIINELNSGEKICLEINNSLYILQDNILETQSCVDCDMFKDCHSFYDIFNYNNMYYENLCLKKELLKEKHKNKIFKKINEYEIVFGSEKYENI